MNIKGLTAAQVEKRIQAGKVNRFKKGNAISNLDIVFRHFKGVGNQIIFIAVVFLVAYKQFEDALIVASVIGFNMTMSTIQEIITRNQLSKISLVHEEAVKVLRDGSTIEVSPRDIVEDDVLVVDSGHYLFVDGELLAGDHILFDESVLTGESDYIAKLPGDKLMSGSFVVAGHGYYKATRVGEASFVNKMTIEAKKYIDYQSPLQIYVKEIVKIMTYIALMLILTLFTLDFFFTKFGQEELFNAMISIVSALVPQGLLVTVTVAFLVGVVKMYNKNILVQRSNAIEALASIKVLCMDKTGTLTENKLLLSDYVPFKEMSEYSAEELIALYCEHTIEKNKTVLAIKEAKEFRSLVDEKGNLAGKDVSVAVVKQIPFTSKRKFSGIEIMVGDKMYRIVLGAVDSLNSIIHSETDMEYLLQQEENFANLGQRNLIFVVKELTDTGKASGKPMSNQDWDVLGENDYSLLAMVSLKDKLRPGTNNILQSFIKRGVKPVIISGDNATTLKALLKQLDIDVLDKVTTGQDLENTRNEIKRKELILGSDVFARTTPDQKLEIIKVYRQHYGSVAMIGDGVNDALAIKQSSLGIAMGDGSSVTRNIADVILLDNDLRKLSEVIKQGKDILYNSLRCAQILTVKNLYSVSILIVTLLFDFHFPFTPRNLFLLSFVNANFPVWAILADNNDDLKEVNFMQDLLSFVFSGGILVGIISALLQAYLNYSYEDSGIIISIFLAFLTLVGIVHYLEVLNGKRDWRMLAAGLSAAIFLAFMYVPTLARFIGLTEMSANQWLALLALAIVYRFLFRAFKSYLGRFQLARIFRVNYR